MSASADATCMLMDVDVSDELVQILNMLSAIKRKINPVNSRDWWAAFHQGTRFLIAAAPSFSPDIRSMAAQLGLYCWLKY